MRGDPGTGKQKYRKSYQHGCYSDIPLCPYTLPEIYDLAAMTHPESLIKFVRPEEVLSHGDLYKKAMQISKGLLALGIKRGDTMACFGTEGSDGLALFMAASSIGVIFNTPHFYTPHHVTAEFVVTKLEPRILILGSARSGIDDLPVYEGSITCLKRHKELGLYLPPHIFYDSLLASMDGFNHQTLTSDLCPMDDLIRLGSLVSDSTLEEAKRSVSMNEPCLYGLSSGTTGTSKVIVQGAATYTNAGQRRKLYNMNKNTVSAVCNLATSEYHLIDELVASLELGYEVIIVPQSDFLTTEFNLAMIEKYRPQFLTMDMGYTADIVFQKEMRSTYDLSSLTCIAIDGSVPTEDYLELLTSMVPNSINIYGLSEFFCGATPHLGDLQHKPTTVGKVFPNVELMIVDEEYRPVPVNTRGHLLLRGYSRMIEYKDDPELTANAFTSDGWFKTGDCALMDEDGDIFIHGRINKYDRFKTESDVVYAYPIEKKLLQNSKIHEIAVIGIYDKEQYCDGIVYCISLVTGCSMTEADVLAYVKQKEMLSPEWPSRVFFYESLPRRGFQKKLSKQALVKDVKRRIEKDEHAGCTAHHESM